MQRFYLYGILSWLILVSPAKAQPARSHDPVHFTGRLDYDTFFGFYPSLMASRSLDSLHEVTAYGIFYPNPAFFGAETGLTLRVTSPRKHWSVAPGAGLVSGSVFVEDRPFVLAEGWVGSLTVQYEQTRWYGQVYGMYYGVLKRRLADTYDFGIYSLQIGRIVSQRLRIGLVYARLGYIRQARNLADPNQFDVSRFGLSSTLGLPLGLTVEVIGGLTRGIDRHAFYQVGISRSLNAH